MNNYVTTQTRNHPASQTVFKTKPKWRAALSPGGEAAAQVFKAPEGYDGFVIGYDNVWTDSTGALPNTPILLTHQVSEVAA